jgi:site-specific recombinase XerD
MIDGWLIEALAFSRKRLRPSSRAVYESMWRAFCSRAKLEMAGSGHLTDESLSVVLKGLGTFATQKRQFMLYKWTIQTLRSAGLDLRNPSEALEREYSHDERATHTVNDLATQVDQMAACAQRSVKGWKGTRLTAVVRVLGDTGLKTQELLALKSNHVLMQPDGCAALWAGKKGSSRLLPLTGSTHEAILAWMRVRPSCSSEFLFISDASGSPLEASTVWRQIKRLEAEVGALGPTLSGPTAIRAAYAKNLQHKGKSDLEIQTVLGHLRCGSTGELLERVTKHFHA